MKQTDSFQLNLFTKLVLLCFTLCFIFTQTVYAEKITLKENHPQKYTVVKGDTLWDISGEFLQHPWQWPEIWDINSQIQNPHLIYPGDVIYLVYVNGKPVLRRNNSGQRPTYKLSPHKRIEKLDLAIPTIPLGDLAPFLIQNRIVEAETLQMAPYVLDTSEEHLLTATDYSVYVRGVSPDSEVNQYGIYRKGRTITNPANKEEILAYEAVYLGEGHITRLAKTEEQVSKFKINKARAEVLNGSRLLPLNNDNYNSHFMPKAAQTAKTGTILAQLSSGVSPSLTHVAATDIAIINFGKQDNVVVGDVFHIYRKGRKMIDPYDPNKEPVVFEEDNGYLRALSIKKNEVQLPHERIGYLLIFSTFEKVSYAMIMDSTSEVRIGDVVASPYVKQY
ncbi:MAG: LysM peptidoglycan-binding domain-containing protein [Gammaproteobacteria bacterium]|nr:LysM peptidoglycan-binding domain-containing protein [Gammaproteobacteria bacterium]